MKRKDKHINKFLHDSIPDPEVPADDAWASMNDMLAANSVQGTSGPGQLSNVWKAIARFKGLLIGTSVVVTSAAVALIVLNSETKNQKYTEKQSINSTIQHTAPENADPKTNALKPGTESTGITATSASETPVSKIPTPGTPRSAEPALAKPASAEPPTSKPAPATASSEKSLSKTTNAPGTIGAGGRSGSTVAAGNHAISTNRRMEENAGRAGSAQARNTPRPRYARVPADVHEKERTALSGTITRETENDQRALSTRVTRQNNPAPPGTRLTSGQAAQETVPSFSHENDTHAAPSQVSLSSLKSLSGHFESSNNNLSKLVKKPALPNAPQPRPRSRNPMWQDIHFGPEWNINRSIVSPAYMFTNADSIKRPLRLAVPGVFVSKSWNRHSATFIFNPLHAYLGNKERVAQRLDTIRTADSSYFVNRHNTNFVKAFGLNFSLQYQYRAFSLISLVGGVSYAKYSSALLFREIEYPTGAIAGQDHLAAKGQDTLKSYIRPQQWNIRAGLLFHSRDVFNNRLQFAWMTIIPISDLSLKGFKGVKTPNMQFSLRFLIQ